MSHAADQGRTNEPSDHQRLIDGILKQFPEARSHGLWRALIRLPDADYMPDILTHDREWRTAVRFVPDAWLIDAEARQVVVFEVIIHHDVTPDKFARMHELSWALDEDWYRLVLVRCDLTGRRAYDVQTAGMAMEWDKAATADAGVLRWQRYTTDYCNHLCTQEPARQGVLDRMTITQAEPAPELLDV